MTCVFLLYLFTLSAFRCFPQTRNNAPLPPDPRLALQRFWTRSYHKSASHPALRHHAFYSYKTVSNPTSPGGVKGSHDGIPTFHESPLSALTPCPGCGALAQTVEPDQPGFYSVKRNLVGRYLKPEYPNSYQNLKRQHDSMFESAIKQVSPELPAPNEITTHDSEGAVLETPLCNRCHGLVHHHRGSSVVKPSLDSVKKTILQSPWQRNHIYHVMDAADFPMSLIAHIHRGLSLFPPRSRNRRATHAVYRHGKKTDLSYVITRSDLLVPKKEQVDCMMPYLVDVLRNALGKTGENVRLGNVRCVSSKRGWWTKELKQDIWKRGGAGWMVGKANVGKSNLFEVAFPKGHMKPVAEGMGSTLQLNAKQAQMPSNARALLHPGDEQILLPPARLETQYPTMPTVSALPGTTASPIRVPYGSGKGELVDLPGLERSKIFDFVRSELQVNLVMDRPLKPKQKTMKPGDTLLLGGLIRIQLMYPLSITTFLVYNFTKLKARHFSEGEFRDAIQGGMKPSTVITNDEAIWKDLRCAGRYALRFDVTKERAGPLTRQDALGLKPSDLTFVVLGIDVLIEGIGWIEIAAQVRRKELGEEASSTSANVDKADLSKYPAVEVFSPKGTFVSYRRPMNASISLRNGNNRLHRR